MALKVKAYSAPHPQAVYVLRTNALLRKALVLRKISSRFQN